MFSIRQYCVIGMWMAVHRSACHGPEMYKDCDSTMSLEVVYTHGLWWQVRFGADGKEGWGTGKGTLWQALEALSSIAGKGGVQKRMKGNNQWISISASCRDVWTAWLSHSQLSFSEKRFFTVEPLVSWFYGFMLYLKKCTGKTYNTDSI